MRSKLLALSLVLAVTVVASLLSPQVSAQNCTCLQHHNRTTTAACSTNVSCSASESCLYDYLSGFVYCEYGTCYENLVITQSCFNPAPGSYQVNGYLEYRCLYCF
jgi:hypothetical protein